MAAPLPARPLAPRSGRVAPAAIRPAPRRAPEVQAVVATRPESADQRERADPQRGRRAEAVLEARAEQRDRRAPEGAEVDSTEERAQRVKAAPRANRDRADRE